MDAWEGKPKWDGQRVELHLERCFIALVCHPVMPLIEQPLCILIEGSDDHFMPVFSTEDKLHPVIVHTLKKLNLPGKYTVTAIEDPEKFFDCLRAEGIRNMIDPIIVNDHHTKWFEAVRDGDVYKYLDSSNE